jgi:hypothetical protein
MPALESRGDVMFQEDDIRLQESLHFERNLPRLLACQSRPGSSCDHFKRTHRDCHLLLMG